ncbi:hypothetical protein [Sphingomonas sp. 2SG]|uniref:hypothetical protein n=1 Tax=Sphingomonas sp. 2SG TaxID=2502201 RepID=UPI001485A137|nr:hypothetical protein [Sphingomonas sp. 2SG]
MTDRDTFGQDAGRRDGAAGNRPFIRRVIIVMIAFLAVSMAGMLALGIALYRS